MAGPKNPRPSVATRAGRAVGRAVPRIGRAVAPRAEWGPYRQGQPVEGWRPPKPGRGANTKRPGAGAVATLAVGWYLEELQKKQAKGELGNPFSIGNPFEGGPPKTTTGPTPTKAPTRTTNPGPRGSMRGLPLGARGLGAKAATPKAANRAPADQGYGDQRAGERTSGTRATPTPTRPAPSTTRATATPMTTTPKATPAPEPATTAKPAVKVSRKATPKTAARQNATTRPRAASRAGPPAPVGVDKATWAGIVSRSLAKYGRPPSADAAAATYLRRMKTPEERAALAGIRRRSAKRYGGQGLGAAAVLATFNRTHPKKKEKP